MKTKNGLSNYTHFTTFYSDMHEEPRSHAWGQRVMLFCYDNEIPYKTTWAPDAPECTIWVKKGYVIKLRKLLKK